MANSMPDESSEPSVKLPDDLTEFVAQLDILGLKLAETRSKYIAGREDSGIEQEWLEDEEYYEGIDDTNRDELKAWKGKPLGQASPADEDDDEPGSTIFLNITRPYVDSTAARISDMLFPAEERGYKLKPTPIPELIEATEGKVTSDQSFEVVKNNPTDPNKQDEDLASIVSEAEAEIKKAAEAAKKAEDQIWDWHVESKYQAHNRRIVEDSTKVGTGVLKGPIPSKKTKKIFRNGEIEKLSAIKPSSVRIQYRNFFPDPACGEDIQSGNGTWERDDITRRKLINLLGSPGYITSQIKLCITEGPSQATKEFTDNQDTQGLKANAAAQQDLYEIWYHYGIIRSVDLLNIDILSNKEDISAYEDEYVDIHLIMVNNRVIKASLSLIEGGEFPYDLMVWQRRIGMPWGIGIARQVRPAQQMILGAIRHMMDNAGIAGGPMAFIDTTVIQPQDGVNEIKPWKIFIPAEDYETSGADKTHAQEAIQFITAPSMQNELQAIVELGLRMAEDVTGMPQIMQGQVTQRTPDTLGGMQLQNKNASGVLRRMARLYDDYITIPHIQRYYEYILEYVDDDSMKGDISVQALGSISLVERDIADQAISTMADLVMNPVFGKDPKKWIDEIFKINKISPSLLDFDDEQWEEIVNNMSQPPPPDPKLEIAQLKVQADKETIQYKTNATQQLETMKNQTSLQLAEFETQSKERYLQIENQINAQEANRVRAHEAAILQFEKEIDIHIKEVGESGSNTRNLQTIKQKLQDSVMKLKVQVQLNDREVSAPLVEPAGRAPDGESYSK